LFQFAGFFSLPVQARRIKALIDDVRVLGLQAELVQKGYFLNAQLGTQLLQKACQGKVSSFVYEYSCCQSVSSEKATFFKVCKSIAVLPCGSVLLNQSGNEFLMNRNVLFVLQNLILIKTVELYILLRCPPLIL
jgi:hypothetical protein